MKKEFVGVRIPTEILAKIDDEGSRSDIINRALVKHFSGVELNQVLNELKEIKATLQILMQVKPVINLNLPNNFQLQPKVKKLSFWDWFKKK